MAFFDHGIFLRVTPAYRALPRDLLARATPLPRGDPNLHVEEPGDLLLSATLRGRPEPAEFAKSVLARNGEIDWPRLFTSAQEMMGTLERNEGFAFMNRLYDLRGST